MILRRIPALLLATLVVAGCGAQGRAGEDGTSRLWVTKERGAVVLLDTTVPAGQTLLRALRSRADVATRYGGRFVQSIEGIEGSLARSSDWFWFVNGLTGDTSAAEYRLRPGDVAWWDYRDWSRDRELDVVVGAFPEPFLHGFSGKVRSAAVRYATPAQRAGAEAVARLIRAGSVEPAGTPVANDANLFELVEGQPRFRAALRTPGAGPETPVRFIFAGDAEELARNPRLAERSFGLP